MCLGTLLTKLLTWIHSFRLHSCPLPEVLLSSLRTDEKLRPKKVKLFVRQLASTAARI